MHVASSLTVRAVPGVPRVWPGCDLAALVAAVLDDVAAGDVVAVASKLVSRAEGRFVLLEEAPLDAEAERVAAVTGHDPRLVAWILAESVAVSRMGPGVLITRHRLGHVCANAGIDASNASGRLLLLPLDPDASARRLRVAVRERRGVDVGVIVTDSWGRPFREGSVGFALGLAGLPALWDQRGRVDLDGRPLQHTVTGLADQVAAAADLVAGQADEGRGVVVVRGLAFDADEASEAGQLQRAPTRDLYA